MRSKGRDGTGEHHQRAQGFGLRRRVLIRSVSASMAAITASLHTKTAVVRQNFAIWPRQNLNGLLQKKTGILLGRRGSDFLEDSAEPARKGGMGQYAVARSKGKKSLGFRRCDMALPATDRASWEVPAIHDERLRTLRWQRWPGSARSSPGR